MQYIDYIKTVLSDEERFKNFRQNRGSSYRTVLEHLTEHDGKRYYQEIKKRFDNHADILRAALKNDELGNPEVYKYAPDIHMNPTTMRYCFVALEILETFKNLRDVNYIEIGAGYGGQCRILHSLVPMNSVTLFDLPIAMQLQERFLQHFSIEVSKGDIRENFDIPPASLVVSNYAWCELDREHRNVYMEKVLNKCDKFYLTAYDIDVEGEFSHFENIEIEKDFFNGCYIIKKLA